jgi:molecular chaperone DnaJ
VKPHPLFQREGDNLIYELPINFAQAALGDEVELPTLDGQVKLRIPAGTQFGHTFKIKGHGIPHLGQSGQGDLLVVTSIVTPRSLNKEQRKVFEELAKSLEKPHFSTGKEGKSGLFYKFRKKTQVDTEN